MSLPIPLKDKQTEGSPLTCVKLLDLGPPKSFDTIRKNSLASDQQSIAALPGPTLPPPNFQQTQDSTLDRPSIVTSSSSTHAPQTQQHAQGAVPEQRSIYEPWETKDDLRLMQTVTDHLCKTGKKRIVWATIATEFNSDDRQHWSEHELCENYWKLRNAGASVASLQQAVINREAATGRPREPLKTSWDLEDQLALMRIVVFFHVDSTRGRWTKVSEMFNLGRRQPRTLAAMQNKYHELRAQGESVDSLEQKVQGWRLTGISLPAPAFLDGQEGGSI